MNHLINCNAKSKLKNIRIYNKCIGTGKPYFIIAEAGVNHNGNLRLAKKLVDEAKKASDKKYYSEENDLLKKEDIKQILKHTGIV